MCRGFAAMPLALAAGVMVGCRGWDMGGHWLGDGNSDADEARLSSDTPAGRDAAQRLERTIK